MSAIYSTPRTGDEMQRAIIPAEDGRTIPIHKYSEICQMMGEFGPMKTIKELYRRGGEKHLILLQNPENMNSGHWISLTILPRSHRIFFFSSYGGKPDEEKNRWLDRMARIASGQDRNPLNDGLKELHNRGWAIHYNDFPYQIEGDGSATCGIWTAAFLNMNLTPDEFEYFTRRHKLTYNEYYNAFFNRRE